MTSLTIQIPDHVAKSLVEEGAQRRITPEGVAAEQLTSLSPVATKDMAPVSYASLFAAATGPGTFKTREEVDRYISELRAE